jgi:phosphonate transport system substrate-binding protein
MDGARQALSVATHLAPDVEPLYRFLAEAFARALGRRTEFVVADGYERCAQDVDDVCFVCSIPYLLLADAGSIEMEAIAAPVLAGHRFGGRAIYFSDVIVAADSPCETFADLRGARWAYNEPYSHSGYVTVLHHLATLGEDRSFFGDMVEAGFHQEALRMVAAGRVDGAAIDCQVLDIELRHRPEQEGAIRRIGSIGPSTIQPVVASRSRLDRAERATITEILLRTHQDPDGRRLLDRALVDRFVSVDEQSYDDIRHMLATVRGAGLLPDWWDERWQRIQDA